MTASLFIAKVYRQHNSLVIVVPQPVCVALDVRARDHIVFEWNNSDGRFKVSKFELEGKKDAGRKGTTNQPDTSGRA